MRALILLALVSLTASAQQRDPRGRFERVNRRCDQGRSNRGLDCNALAFFEFAPSNGAGMGTACACTAVTGAKGETMTYARAGNATCNPAGMATTGITNASLVECGANLPRIEPSGGVLGIRATEAARTNVLTRFIDYANIIWTDVATPTLTGAQVSPWTGTYANLAVQFDDNDAVAFEGRTQTVTVTAAAQYTMSCFVKAGTLTTARLSLDGTTADFTGLSSTTWTLASVTDASSSGVAIAAQALNGSTAAATGTVIWGGCQVEAGAFASAMIPTVAAGVARNADDAYFDLPTFTLGNLSLAATAQTPDTTTVRRLHGALTKSPDDGLNFIATYQDTGVVFGQFTSAAGTSTWNTGLATTTGPVRMASFINGSTVGACINGSCATNPIGTFNPAQITSPRRLRIGAYSTTNGTIDGIQTLICLEPDSPTRCR
jgi:hypothetical protein